MLVLAVLWWCWVVHCVVATRVRLGEGFVPVLMVVGMAALFCFALSLPQAFSDATDAAAGPMVVALSYVVIRGVHLTLYLARRAGETRRAPAAAAVLPRR